MKPSYTLIIYNSKPRIKISFDYNPAWNKKMQTVFGAEWSKTLKGRTIPGTPEKRKKWRLDQVDTALIKQQSYTLYGESLRKKQKADTVIMESFI